GFLAPLLVVRPLVTIGAEGDQVFDAVVLALAPRKDVRLLQRRRVAADCAAMTRLVKDLALDVDGDVGAIAHATTSSVVSTPSVPSVSSTSSASAGISSSTSEDAAERTST